MTDGESFNYWSEAIREVPVQVHGSLPGHPEAALMAVLAHQPKPVLTAGLDDAGARSVVSRAGFSPDDPRKLVIFINPRTDLTPAQTCHDGAVPQEQRQNGRRARIDAVLCSGAVAVAISEGTIPATGQSDSDILDSVAAVEDSMVQALRPMT
jgi:hypothetical protein